MVEIFLSVLGCNCRDNWIFRECRGLDSLKRKIEILRILLKIAPSRSFKIGVYYIVVISIDGYDLAWYCNAVVGVKQRR